MASESQGRLRFGLGFLSGQVPVGSGRTAGEEYADSLRVCELAEELGFDSAWLTEHHGAGDSYLPALPVMLGAIAARTSRIELGMGVALAPFHHPLRFAEDCAVIDQLAGGRLVPGLGIAWREEEFRAFGIPMAERAQRTVELLEICRLAWSQDRFSYQSRHWNFDQVAVTPKPARPLPVFLGGFAEAAVRRAGRMADGFIASRGSLEGFQRQVQWVDDAAREAGRDPALIRLAVNLYCWVDAGGNLPDEVAQAVWNAQGIYVAWNQSDAPGVPLRFPPLDRNQVDRTLLLGDPAGLAERLRPWSDAFRDRDFELIVRLHYPGLGYERAAAALELFAREVMPRLRVGEATKTRR